MHVDVDALRRDAEKEVDLRAPFLDRRNAVGFRNRVRDRAVLHDPAVDEHVLRAADRALIAQRGDESFNREAASLLSHVDEIRAVAKELKETFPQVPRRGALEQGASSAGQREAYFGIAERQLRGKPRYLGQLRSIGLQELATRRQVVEKVGDLDAGAFGRPHLANGSNGTG